jgi:hypothetical protein
MSMLWREREKVEIDPSKKALSTKPKNSARYSICQTSCGVKSIFTRASVNKEQNPIYSVTLVQLFIPP